MVNFQVLTITARVHTYLYGKSQLFATFACHGEKEPLELSSFAESQQSELLILEMHEEVYAIRSGSREVGESMWTLSPSPFPHMCTQRKELGDFFRLI